MNYYPSMGAVGAVGPTRTPPRTIPADDELTISVTREAAQEEHRIDDALLVMVSYSMPIGRAIRYLLANGHSPRGTLYAPLVWRERIRRLTSNVYVSDDLVQGSWAPFAYQEEYTRIGWCQQHLPNHLQHLIHSATPLDDGIALLDKGGNIYLSDASLGSTLLNKRARLVVPEGHGEAIDINGKWAMVIVGSEVHVYASSKANRNIYERVDIKVPSNTRIVRAFTLKDGRHCIQDMTGIVSLLSKYRTTRAKSYVADRTLTVDVLTLSAPTYLPPNVSASRPSAIITKAEGFVTMGSNGQIRTSRSLL